MAKAFSTSVEGLDLPLWKDVPTDSWLRVHGRTRVVVVDDQWSDRESLFAVASNSAPQSDVEKYLLDWLNVEIEFMPMPNDYRLEESGPIGTFSEQWFEDSLKNLICGSNSDNHPVSAILLDLMYGDQESDIDNASGVRFLRIIRRHFPDIPVLIVSNISESRRVLEKLKLGDDAEDEFFSSFDDFVPKKDPQNPAQSLFERIAHKLVQYGHLTDPTICAYSAPMRRVALEMRQIVLSNEHMKYENASAAYPTPVTIIGEWGSGKNYISKQLFRMSRRRMNPLREFSFTDVTETGAISSLFGVGTFTDVTELYYTDIRTGAVVDILHKSIRKTFPNHIRPLGKIGVFQSADMGDLPQAVGAVPKPLKSTVILDELGTASSHIQQRLISVFNRGQFMPENVSFSVPTERQLDLWFLFPCTPKAFEGIIGDIRSRLFRCRSIRIPSLYERSEDILPLAMTLLHDECVEHPTGRVFSQSAIEWLINRMKPYQIRHLEGTVRRLRRKTGYRRNIIINAGDVKAAFEEFEREELTKENRIILDSPSQVLDTTSEFRSSSVPTTHNPSIPPSRLGDYLIREKLGSGGMGSVYRAFQESLRRYVALKVLSPEATEADIKRFLSEARSVAQLSHPNIISVYDVDVQDGWNYFSMELIEGQSLDEIVRCAPMMEKKAAQLIATVSDAVHYAHGEGIIHRDIKPSNIMLKGQEPILTDFGLAKLVVSGDEITHSDKLVGTPAFMAPEQFEGNSSGVAADIYALGATLYQLLTGRLPFAASTFPKTLKLIMQADPIPPTLFDSTIDSALDGICLRCLQKKPSDRYSTAMQLASDIRRFLVGEPTESASPSKMRISNNLESLQEQHARRVYEYLDSVVAQIEEKDDFRTLSALDVWRFVTDDKGFKNSNQAQSCIAKLLLAHAPYAKVALPNYKRLMHLANLVKDRNKELELILRDLRNSQ